MTRHFDQDSDQVARARGLADRVYPLIKAECDAGNIEDACLTLAGFYASGEHGAPRDMDKAVTLFTRLCKQKDPFACSTLAFMYDEGDGVKRSRRKAKKLIKKACRYGNQEACDWGLNPP